MAVTLPPVPYKSPIADRSGFLAAAWASWFREMFLRIGGTSALSNTELASIPATLQTDVTALQTLTASHTASIAALQNELNQGPVL